MLKNTDSCQESLNCCKRLWIHDISYDKKHSYKRLLRSHQHSQIKIKDRFSDVHELNSIATLETMKFPQFCLTLSEKYLTGLKKSYGQLNYCRWVWAFKYLFRQRFLPEKCVRRTYMYYFAIFCLKCLKSYHKCVIGKVILILKEYQNISLKHPQWK